MTDIATSFTAHPDTGQLFLVKGSKAIAARVRNLVLTNQYDWPYQPTLGANINKLLFENFSPQTTAAIQTEIELVLTNHASQSVSDINVVVTANPGTNSYVATISYTEVQTSAAGSVAVTLTRVR